MKYTVAGLVLMTGIGCAQGQLDGIAQQNDAEDQQLAVAPDSDGFLLHRGRSDDAEAVVANAGGVGLQGRSYELRSWLPEFVLIRRGEKTYLIENLQAVQHIWKLWDESAACRQAVEAATPDADELQKALAVCKISTIDIAVAQELRKRLTPSVASRWNIVEVITQSRIWNALDQAISTGAAHLN